MKRWIPVLGLCAGSLLSATTANAETVIGARSCGQWMGRNANSIDRMVQESWLLGMLSGLALGTKFDFLAQTDAKSIYLWMDNYCQSHPLDNMVQGADALGAELIKRMHN